MNWIEELLHDISSISSTEKDLKKFGLTIGSAAVILAIAALWKEWWNTSALIFLAALGIVFIFAGLLFPKLLFWINKGWMSIAVVIGSIVSRVILFILFFAVLTPIALVARISGKRFFVRYKEESRSSYWIERDKNKRIKYDQMF